MKVLETTGRGEIALVLDSPHSGHDFPEDFDACVSERDLREGEDMFVHELWSAAPSVGAPFLAARFPRTYLDPNRHAGDIDPDLLDRPWPWEYVPSGKARLGKSLVWRTLEDGRSIYARRLTPEEVKRRIDRFHQPYHRALMSLLEDSSRKNGRVYHINCHSMRSVAGRQSDDGEGRRRADFVLGDRDGTTCEPGFTAFVTPRGDVVERSDLGTRAVLTGAVDLRDGKTIYTRLGDGPFVVCALAMLVLGRLRAWRTRTTTGTDTDTGTPTTTPPR